MVSGWLHGNRIFHVLLHAQVVNASDSTDLTASFNNLLEAGLQYITLIAKYTEQHAQDQTFKFWRALLHKAYDILDKVSQ